MPRQTDGALTQMKPPSPINTFPGGGGNHVWIAKSQTAVDGPYDPIQIPGVSEKVEYEVELVVIVGRGGEGI